MKTFAKVLAALGLLLAALATTVAMLGSRAEPLPPLDPSMLITMPDGSSMPLEALVARADDDTFQATIAPPAVDASPPAPSAGDPDVDRDDLVERLVRESFSKRRYVPGLLGHADRLLDAGEVDQALAVLQSIGPDDRHYARAQRKIGWDVMTKTKGQPARGVAYVTRCLGEDPFDDNAWEDAVRVWSRTLGVPVN